MPQSQFFHTDSWKGGLDVSDAPEDSVPGQSFDMQDMEVTTDDRLVKAPGVALEETLTHEPTQMFLHAGFQYASDIIFIAAPYIGAKGDGSTIWWNAGLSGAAPYGWTNFAGVLLLSNGTQGIYARRPHKNVLELIEGSVAGFGLTVFAGRVVVGGAQNDGKLDFMGVAWSDSSGDYKGWDPALGSAGQSLIGTSLRADRFQAFGALGFDTLTVVCRRSIWIGVPTGDEFQPIRFSPRLEDTGCSHAATVCATEFGVIFLADDGVRIFTGSEAPLISDGITRYLGPILESDDWSASFDPNKKRYYLHGPTGTFVYDLLRKRWFRWTNSFVASVFFPSQGTQLTWGEAIGTWGAQTLAWWQLLPQESGGTMHFIRDAQLGVEDAASYGALGQLVDPLWFDRVKVAENHDVLMTALGVRVTYESTLPCNIEVHLPDKPDGNYELVSAATLPAGTGFTKRAWIPLIHTGRSVGLGIRLLSGTPRIRRASVEYQETALPWELESTVSPTPVEPPPDTLPVSAAIIKPKIVYIQSAEVGGFQALDPVRDNSQPLPTDWEYHQTGGPGDKGYLVTAAVTDTVIAHRKWAFLAYKNPDVVFYSDVQTNVRRGGMFARFNLFGQTLSIPLAVMAAYDFMQPSGGGPFYTAQFFIEVWPDLSVRVRTPAGVQIGTTLAPRVPADGWFGLEPQWAISRLHNDTSGFMLAKLYTPETVATDGELVVNAINTEVRGGPTGSDSFVGFGVGSQCDPTKAGLAIGLTDIVLYQSGGSERRFIRDTIVRGVFVNGHPNLIQPEFIKKDEYHSESFEAIVDESEIFGGVTITATDVVEIEGVQPFSALATNVTEYTAFEPNVAARYKIKSNGVTGIGRWSSSLFGWLAYSGLTARGYMPFTINPDSFFAIDPDGSVSWRLRPLGKLQTLLAGVGGDFAFIDATNAEVPGAVPTRRIDLKVGQLGFEYAYHAHPPAETEHPAVAPRAAFWFTFLTDASIRRANIADASQDYDGEIVSNVIDWGDSSPTEDLDPDGITALNHVYATHGVKTITQTVTDSDGNVTVYTDTFTIPNVAPVANFSVADAGGNLADLTDTSTDSDGTIVSWQWKVDGVQIATTQNVVGHDFGAPGTYNVYLKVTDDGGLTSEANTDVDIPLGAPADCGLSATTLADTPGFQGDDYNGGNPPLPAYVNTAAYDVYYEGSTYRQVYDIAYASAGVDHRLTSSVMWNGHKTLEMDFGAGHFGGGWDSALSDDGDPVETNAPFFHGYRSLWLRRIFAAEAGVMSDAGAVGFNQGLVILGVNHQLSFSDSNIVNRGGNLYLDNGETVPHGGNSAPILIAPDNFVGSGTFNELIMLLERENEGDGSYRVRVWYGVACSLGGVSPLVNQLFTPSGFAGTNGAAGVRNFNVLYTPTGGIKHLWLGLHEMGPRIGSEGGVDNPFGVGLT